MQGHSLRLEKADKLATYFGLTLVTTPPSPLRQSSQTLTDALKTAIEQSGLSRYQIAKDTEVEEAAICRFMQGHGLLVVNVDKLAAYLGLNLVRPPTPCRWNRHRKTWHGRRGQRERQSDCEQEESVPVLVGTMFSLTAIVSYQNTPQNPEKNTSQAPKP